MSIFRKQFNSPFIVEKSKLKRLIEVVGAKFTENGTSPQFEFEAHLAGQKVIETGSVEEVLALDNSKRNRVERLVMNCTRTRTTEQEEMKRGILVDFDGRSSVAIYLAVKGEDAQWAGETFRAAEDQVERTLERSTMNWLSHRGASTFFSLFAMIFFVTVLVGVSENMVPYRLTNTMWLTDEDLKTFEPLQANPALASEKAGEILSRQIRNVTIARQQRLSKFAWFTQWRFILGVTPPLLILGAVGYLYFKCYPNAVFLWGDAEDWYKTLQQRRKLIWSGIIVAFAIGVLANLFVFALAPRN